MKTHGGGRRRPGIHIVCLRSRDYSNAQHDTEKLALFNLPERGISIAVSMEFQYSNICCSKSCYGRKQGHAHNCWGNRCRPLLS